MVKHWNTLPREAVDGPFLETFRATLDGNPGQVDLLGGNPAHDKGLELNDI